MRREQASAPPEMKAVAAKEYKTPEEIRDAGKGSIAIPAQY